MRFFTTDCAEAICPNGVARVDPETNAVVATAFLREGWLPSGGIITGPTTAWTFNPDAVACIDF